MVAKPWYIVICTDVSRDNQLIFVRMEMDGTPESGVDWGREGLRFTTATGELIFCPYILLESPVVFTQTPEIETSVGYRANTH